MSATKKIVTIVGATGNQGAGVIATLVNNPSYQLRAITRRPTSPAALALAEQGIEVVTADLNDEASLKAAFVGTHTIFAATDFFEPFGKHGAQVGMEVEIGQGLNLARAAAATPTLEQYIWSTLPNSRKITNGKYVVPHFEGKNQIDAFIRSDKALLAKTTFLWVTWFHSNFTFPMFTPYYIPTADRYVQFANHSPETPIITIGDVRKNVGPFVEAIFAKENASKVNNGAIVIAEIGNTTAGELLEKWGKANGKKVSYVRTDVETYNALWPMWAEEMGGMMRFWDEFRETSWVEAGVEVLTRENLGIETTRFVELEDSLATMKF